jgi:uncharacterized integral membrane protein
VKAFRIIQIVILVALVGYLFWLNNWNSQWIELPFLISLPSGVIIGAGILLGWIIGWAFGGSGTWSKTREVSRLKKRIAELEKGEPRITAVNISRDAEPPVIPDRAPGTATTARNMSEYENL